MDVTSETQKRCGGELNTHSDGDEGDGLVNPSQRRNVNSLTSDGTGRADSGGVFSRASVDDGVDYTSVIVPQVSEASKGTTAGEGTTLTEDLDGVLFSDEMYDFEGMLDDPHRHDLLAVVATVHHESVDEHEYYLTNETLTH